MSGITIIILMGVSGCGKTSVGKALEQKLGWPFYDGDDFHPQSNIDKMAKGIPLADDDRWPWLDNVHALIDDHLNAKQSAIVACSALKESYRQRLRQGSEGVVFVHLYGSYDLIWQRMQARQNHYMKEAMLQSQFDALESPTDAIEIEINTDIPAIADHIISLLQSWNSFYGQ